MPTSGTVGSTTIKTAKLLDKAFRRCGLQPQQIAPEHITSASEDLYMILTSMATRGLNLWCVDKVLIPAQIGATTYQLPIGTIEVLNLLHARPSRVQGTDTVDPTFVQTEFQVPSTVVRVGVKFSNAPAESFALQYSEDGVVWITTASTEIGAQPAIWHWLDTAKIENAKFFRIFGTDVSSVAEVFWVSSVREITISQFNRDDYAGQPDKNRLSGTVTNFYFEKLLEPQVTVWPAPADDEQHFVLFRHRQIQDVGSLTQELEIPPRWLEAITWHLALRVAFEVPGVDQQRREEIRALAGSMTLEVELGETDKGPINWTPAIGCYTR